MKQYGIFGWLTYRDIPRNEQLLFNGVTFDTFEEAWDFIYINDAEPDETSPDWIDGWYDDYCVELVEQENN